MKRESLDTSIIVRLITKDIEHLYLEAKNLVETNKSRFFVSDAAIKEFVYVLVNHYGLSRTQTADAMNVLFNVKSIDCNRDLARASVDLFLENKTLSFEDCYLAASADYMNATPLWTFDKDLAKKASSAKLLTAGSRRE